jgi:L,D-transpeptidase ErfK/SrfK
MDPPLEAVAPPGFYPPESVGRPRRRLRGARWFVAAGLLLMALLAIAALGTGYGYEPPPRVPVPLATELPQDEAALKKSLAKLRSEQKLLQAKLQKAAPAGIHIIIDQTQNRLYLKNGDQFLLKAVCSAGSGLVLQEEGGKNRRWVFDTPRGVFKVLNKIEDPIWKKPDWAFIEEGKPIPRNEADRFEAGSLGAYALYFGNGYLIHGTLYERMLGRSVTHGCIRLGRDDLRAVYNQAPLGTPVYIY